MCTSEATPKMARHCARNQRRLAPIRTLTVGLGISPSQPTAEAMGSRAFTAGRGFHPTLQVRLNCYVEYRLRGDCRLDTILRSGDLGRHAGLAA